MILAKAILLWLAVFVATILFYPRTVRTEHRIIVGVAAAVSTLVVTVFMFLSY